MEATLELILKKVQNQEITIEQAKQEILSLLAPVTTIKLEPPPPPTLYDQSGGVYMLQITSISNQPVQFYYQDKLDDRFVLVKFGRADSYTSRYSQFGFKFTKQFEVNGDNLMESWLKQKYPPNFKSGFYKPKTKVATIKTYLKIPVSSNPGPTEWRVMSKKLVETIKKANIDKYSYQETIKKIKIQAWLEIIGVLKLTLGDYSVVNKERMTILCLASEE